MAEEKIALSIGVDASQATQSVGSFKAQLREATADLVNMAAQFGEGSVQAQNAAKKVASLKDAIGDAKALADTFNPDKKFVALGGALQGAVGGFTALQGAMGLFGSESKEVEKLLLKVQSAMALQQGISAITGSKDAFKLLGLEIKATTVITKVATTVQKLWNAAMAANPVMLMVTAIIAAVAAIANLVSWLGKSSAAAKQQAAAVKDASQALEIHKMLLEESAKALEADANFTIEMAKAQGKSTAEIRKLTLAEQDKKIAIFEAAKVTEQATLKQNEYTLSTLKAADADEELIKSAEDNVTKAREQVESTTKAIAKGYEDRLALERKFQIEDATKATEAAKKKKEKADNDAKDAKKKRDELAKEIAAANKEANNEQRKLEQEIYLQSIDDENFRAQEKLRLDFENKKLEVEQTKATEKEKAETIKLLREKLNSDLRDLELEQMLKQGEQAQKDDDERKQQEEKRNAEELERKKLFLEAKKKQDEEFKKAELEAEKNLQSARYQAIDAGFDLINALAGKNEKVANILFGVQKALEIGKIIVGAASSIAQIKANIAAVPPFLGPAPNPAYFVNLALGLKNIAAVKLGAAAGIATIVGSTIAKFKGGGGGSVQGGGGTPAQPGGTAQTAPVRPQAETTRIDQGQINQIGNAAVRAYVVETEVNSQQERRTRIERAARIG